MNTETPVGLKKINKPVVQVAGGQTLSIDDIVCSALGLLLDDSLTSADVKRREKVIEVGLEFVDTITSKKLRKGSLIVTPASALVIDENLDKYVDIWYSSFAKARSYSTKEVIEAIRLDFSLVIGYFKIAVYDSNILNTTKSLLTKKEVIRICEDSAIFARLLMSRLSEDLLEGMM